MKPYADDRSGLRSKAVFFALVIWCFMLFSGYALALDVSDNFDDNIEDKALWGPDDGYGNGVLTETNHRLEYTVSTPAADGDYTWRWLIASQGAYTADWKTQIDLFNGSKPLGSKKSEVGMDIFRCDSWNDYISVGLYAADGYKSFYGELFRSSDYDSHGLVDSGDLSGNLPLRGSIQVSFNCTTKVISLDYKRPTDIDWIQLGSFGISAAGGGSDGNVDWSMTNIDQVCIDVYGYSFKMAIASGKVYADNFQATEVTTPVSTRVMQPDGTEPVPAGDIYPVSWEAPLAATQFKLQYSMDNGTTWKPMAPGLVPGRAYDWQVLPVPKGNKSNCLVKIIGYNEGGAKIGKAVSASFTIEVASITAPVKDEIVPKGTVAYPVTWITNGISEDVSSAEVFYTSGNSGIWKKAVGTMPAPLTGFNWDVPSPAKPMKAKLKVVFKDASGKKLATAISSVFRIE